MNLVFDAKRANRFFIALFIGVFTFVSVILILNDFYRQDEKKVGGIDYPYNISDEEKAICGRIARETGMSSEDVALMRYKVKKDGGDPSSVEESLKHMFRVISESK